MTAPRRTGLLRGMKVTAGKHYGVITGDIVGSSTLSAAARKVLLAELRRGARAAQKAFLKSVPLPVDIFRGDGWQMLLTDPVRSLRVALFFRCYLLAHAPGPARFDTRLAIAIAPITFVPAKRVSEGDGEAYRASGRALEALRSREWMRLVFPGEATPPAIAAIVALIDSHAQSWTSPQARAVMGALQDWPQERIARLWPKPVAQPTIVRHLEKAGWPAVAAGLQCVEEGIAELSRVAG